MIEVSSFGRPRTVAVIGSGISGLTAAYLLQRVADVTLYEVDGRLGGHTHTHLLGGRTPVDSGFIVYNERTYPLLTRLFGELGIRTRSAEMSMSIHCDGCGLSYAGGRGPAGLFPSPSNLVRPRYLALLAEIPRLHQAARGLLAGPESAVEPTLGEFLAQHGFSPYFTGHFIIPLVSAVWSCGVDVVCGYPARYLFTFLDNHGMLATGRSWSWRTVVGGSNTYVREIAGKLAAVRIGCGVTAVSRAPAGVQIQDVTARIAEFDAVVVAVHADQALRLLADPTDEERSVLGAFSYSANETVLHSDATLLPPARRTRASWNYRLRSCPPAAGRAVVSYDMNRLQGLDDSVPYIVTLNDTGRIRSDAVHDRMIYQHPIYDAAARAAQRRLGRLNQGRTAFAGAYHGWGFHEDGCRSGVAAARSLGASW